MAKNINLPEDVDTEVLNEAVETSTVKKTKKKKVVLGNEEESFDTELREDTPDEDRKVIKEDINPAENTKAMSDEEYEKYIEQIQNSEGADDTILGNLEDSDEFYDNEKVVTPSAPKLNISDVPDTMSFDTKDDEEEDEDESFDIDETEEKRKEKDKNLKFISYADRANVAVNSNPKLGFIDKIVVDLNNIEITDKPIINQVNDYNLVFDSTKSTFSVICCQSCYQACMAGLTLAEKNAINNSESDLFTARQKLYKTIYNKIVSMNFPKPKFDDWLKMTAFGDWSTLLFGVYCQTFIDDNDFDITCGHCKEVTSITVNNQFLIEARDKRVFDKIEEVVSSVKSPEDLLNNSIIHKSHRIMLNDSKIVIDIGTPTLWDHLALIKQSNQKVLQEYADTFSSMLFVKNMFMIDAESSYKTGRPVYYPVSRKSEILNILLKLSNSDGEQFEDAIEEKLGQYQINYRIHNAVCAHCHTKLPDIPVDMETILFRRINKQRKTTNS